MGQRLQLQILLSEILGTQDKPVEHQRVYFQPPANVQMEYPCFTYNWETSDTAFAGNNPYRLTKRYQVTYIDRSPDSDVPEKVAALPMCRHDTTYAADNLNHYVFTLYF